MDAYLAIDAGTGSGRAVLFDAAGRELAVAAAEWWHDSEPGVPGSMNFDCARNWDTLSHCIRQCLSKAGITPGDVRGVSATSMREAFVLIDAAGRELWACANVDARAGAEVAALRAAHPGLESRVYAASGQTFALGALPRLMWLRTHAPEVLAQAHRLLMLSDWVLWRLSGEAATDASNMGTTGLIGLASRAPLPEAMAVAGLPDSLIPPVLDSGVRIGAVTAEAAAATGLAPGTPVVTGGGDCQLGTLALGLTEAGEAAVLGGTFWQTVVNAPRGLTDPAMDLRINPFVLPGLDQAEAISFFIGAVMRWCRDAFGGGRDYAALEAEARQVPPGAYGIIPVFSDVMRYGHWFHAAPSLLNLPLDPVKGGAAAIFRALQENAAIVADRNLKAVFALTGARPERVVFAGGAATSTAWAQILADVTGLEVVTPAVIEATAMGTAAAAAAGTGLAPLPEVARTWVRHAATYRPDPALADLYAGQADRWAAAYAPQRALAEVGITTPMWAAPGTTRT